MNNFDSEEYIVGHLPRVRGATFDSLYDSKPDDRKWNRNMSWSTDADMYSAVQDLIAHKDLPFNSNLSAFMRHAVAATIESLKLFLSKDTRTLWSAFQASQRRLTAERYALVAEEQVKEAAELLEQWTMAQEWDSVYDDLAYAMQMIEELPLPAWKRRMAKAWVQNPAILRLLLGWQDRMAEQAPAVWKKTRAIFDQLSSIASSGD